MKPRDKDELELLVQVLSGLIDEVDSESTDLLEVLEQQAEKISNLPGLPEEMLLLADNIESHVMQMQEDDGSFDELRQSLKKVAVELEAAVLGGAGLEETGSDIPAKRIPTLEEEDLVPAEERQESTAAQPDAQPADNASGMNAEESRRVEVVETGGAEIDPADMEYLEMQADILKGLAEEIAVDTIDLLGPVSNMLHRMRDVDNLPVEIRSKLDTALGIAETAAAENALPAAAASELNGCIDDIHRAFGSDETAAEDPGPAVEFDAPAAPGGEYEAPQEIVIDLDTDNPELMDFVTEVNEYLQDAEVALMEIEKTPGDAGALNEVFRVFHNIKGISGFLNLKDFMELSHNAESLLDSAREGELLLTGEYAGLAFDSVDMLKEMLQRVHSAMQGADYKVPAGYSALLSRLKSLDVVQDAPAAQQAGTVTSAESEHEAPESAPDEKQEISGLADKVISEMKDQVLKRNIDGSVKVNTDRLDNLIDTVGELVIANAMVTQEPELTNNTNPRLARNINMLNKITRELQEIAMSMRMVSLKSTFRKLARVARDLSVKSGVPIDFVTEGEDTELDRNVVEEIASPLVHMVRNAIDHGIESADARARAGKPEKGRVTVSACHEGGSVVIRISDDGMGLNKSAILAKGQSKGLIEPGAELPDSEIYRLIFQPGFSTAETITDISGRGVGMDVVNQAIEKLRGRVEINSEEGAGSAFIIKLPLTLAIIDGMLVEVGDEKYVIPTLSITESIRPTPEQLSTVVGKGEMLTLRGDLIPLYRLYKLFEEDEAKKDPTDALLIVLGSNGSRCAVLVDELLGQQQVVIKSLGDTFRNLEGVSGGAIMGDGKVALILDTQGLVRLANNYN